jgi:hypothetical protein
MLDEDAYLIWIHVTHIPQDPAYRFLDEVSLVIHTMLYEGEHLLRRQEDRILSRVVNQTHQ